MNKKSNIKFQTWLLQNRIRVFIWAFVIVISITLVLVSYLGSYFSNKKIYFDEKLNNDTVIVKDFESIDSIKYLSFNIEWDELNYPILGEDGYNYGSYVFYINYTPKLSYNITSVKVTPLLNTNWVNTRSLGNEATVTTSSRRMAINYNHVLPKKPLLFIKINEPTLYLKVDLKIDFGQTQSDLTIYVKYSLKNLNPNIIY